MALDYIKTCWLTLGSQPPVVDRTSKGVSRGTSVTQGTALSFFTQPNMYVFSVLQQYSTRKSCSCSTMLVCSPLRLCGPESPGGRDTWSRCKPCCSLQGRPATQRVKKKKNITKSTDVKEKSTLVKLSHDTYYRHAGRHFVATQDQRTSIYDGPRSQTCRHVGCVGWCCRCC